MSLQIVSTALLTEHRLSFSFMLTVNIMKNSSKEEESALPGFLPESEWEFFLHSLLLSNVMKTTISVENDGKITGPTCERTQRERSPTCGSPSVKVQLPSCQNMLESHSLETIALRPHSCNSFPYALVAQSRTAALAQGERLYITLHIPH